jgi:uncharacterized membrane protein
VNVPGATGTAPLGIDNHGRIAGAYDDRDGVTHGFLRDRGRFRTIDHPKARGVLLPSQPGPVLAGTALSDINARGQIVGAYVAGNRARGFVLYRGRFTPIDAPGAADSFPFGINARGQITIQAFNPDGTAPQYLLDRGKFRLIEFPGTADTTLVHKVNERGQVVGVYLDDAGTQHGFVFDRGRYARIDVPGAQLTGLNQSNTRGQYIGYHLDEGDDVLHAYVMRRGRVTSFDAPGADGTTAYDINDRGDIVGAGFPPLPGGTATGTTP